MRTVIGVIATIVLLSLMLKLCSPAGGEFPGHEYMPDMAHPVTYEANQISAYKYNHWDEASVRTKSELSQPRKPVSGTVPRGMTAVFYEGETALAKVRGENAHNAISAHPNPYAPFYYTNTEEERIRAMAEITVNPFSPTHKEAVLAGRIQELQAAKSALPADASIARSKADKSIESITAELTVETAKVAATGKTLYDIQCGICHGEKGDGAGYLARDGGPYPVAPANFKSPELIASSEGRYYFAIMYGKNVMGAYADKLSYEERWLVIRHIRSMQQ